MTWGGAAPKGTQDSVSRHTARAQSTGPGVELELSRRRGLWEGGLGEERRQHPPYRPSIDSIDRTERSTILVTAHTRPNPSISHQQGVLDRAPRAEMSGVLHSGNEFLTGKSCERVAAAVPHVDVPDKHFGVALGEARTLRTATKEHLEHRIGTSEMATCEDGIRTRGAGRSRGSVIRARKTRGNRGNIGIAPPPESVCPTFAQSGGWRLALGQMVGNVKGNEGNDDRRSPRRSWCGSTTQLQRDRRPPRRRQASRPS